MPPKKQLRIAEDGEVVVDQKPSISSVRHAGSDTDSAVSTSRRHRSRSQNRKMSAQVQSSVAPARMFEESSTLHGDAHRVTEVKADKLHKASEQKKMHQAVTGAAERRQNRPALNVPPSNGPNLMSALATLPRDLPAVKMPENYIHRPGDWCCPGCMSVQFARNIHCRNCGPSFPKPAYVGF
eukprot:gnl/MRDRNA2_/MRDRNA2_187237_c0_seq1.p1 gnl/MRDRNA2_/MRDRNA2_187237_c0~~gnl/MRDRNA2_/MRDRNA2_187237_c0_seq1.p1  ORF type:complete len:182 (+),score=32.47 gnl/MRDRNA2_/MRDRNA2_187237_c0_seq1:143-688(+)